MIKKIYNEPACLIDDSLIIADLHIGIEKEFLERGISLPPLVGEIKNKIIDLIEISGASRLVILGDLKHNIPRAGWHEYRHISELLQEVGNRVEIVLVKGNHDSLVEELIPELIVLDELTIGDVTLTHGHRALKKAKKNILMAHSHPAILFEDSIGRTKEKAWIVAELTEKGRKHFGRTLKLIIMPAFNPIVSGLAFNTEEIPISPIINQKLVDIENARAYLLDSTYLGRVKDLKVYD